MRVKYKLSSFASKASTDGTQGPNAKGTRKRVVKQLNKQIANAAVERDGSEAARVFDKVPADERTPHTYCSMVNAMVRSNRLSDALAIMEESGYETSRDFLVWIPALTALLKGLMASTVSKDAQEGAALFQLIVRKCAEKAQLVPGRTVDTFLRGCLHAGMFKDAKLLIKNKRVELTDHSHTYLARIGCLSLNVPSALKVAPLESSVWASCVDLAMLAVGSVLSYGSDHDESRAALRRLSSVLDSSSSNLALAVEANEGKSKMQPGTKEASVDMFLRHQHMEGVNYGRWLVSQLKGRTLTPMSTREFSRVHAIGRADSSEQVRKTLGFDRAQPCEDLVGDDDSDGTEYTDSILELCSGSGEWINNFASKNKALRCDCCEIRFDRVAETFQRSVIAGTRNLHVYFADANDFLAKMNKRSRTYGTIYIHHPDPVSIRNNRQPEDGSHLLTSDFFQRLRSVMAPGASVYVVSDNRAYMTLVESELKACFGNQVTRQSGSNYVGSSYFSRMFAETRESIALIAKN